MWLLITFHQINSFILSSAFTYQVFTKQLHFPWQGTAEAVMTPGPFYSGSFWLSQIPKSCITSRWSGWWWLRLPTHPSGLLLIFVSRTPPDVNSPDWPFLWPFQLSSLLKKTWKADYFDCFRILQWYFIWIFLPVPQLRPQSLCHCFTICHEHEKLTLLQNLCSSEKIRAAACGPGQDKANLGSIKSFQW